MNLVFLAVVLIVAFLYYHLYHKRIGYPPGPTPLPFLGNLIPIWLHVEGAFLRWRKQYGPVYTFWLGPQPIVVIADYPTMVETLQKDADSYSGRHYMELFRTIRGGDYGVITTYGELWREQRRFALHVMRDFGLGKNLMQERVLDEVSCLVKRVRTELENTDAACDSGAEINLCAYVDLSVGSLINALLFGYRFDGERLDEFYQLKRLVSKQLKGDWAVALMMQNPEFFRHLPYFSRVLDDYIAGFQTIIHFFDVKIREHQTESDTWAGSAKEWEPPTDYVHAFLREMRKRTLSDDSQHHFSIAQLQNMCLDLWLAGQETTSTTIAWGISHMLHRPETMVPLYEELDRVIGSGRLVTLSDRPNLPYTCAVVQETLRIANILVNAIVSNRTTRDVNVRGVLIREGTPVLPQISALLYDDAVFERPKEFDPTRWIDSDGTLKKVEEFAPFSLGKRQCLGEALARMELFLFIANLFNQFKISPGKRLPSLRRNVGVTVQCPHYTCKVQCRTAGDRCC